MKLIIGAVVFGLILISIIVMLVINFTYRGIKKMRQQSEDDYYRREKEKEQKEKHPFGKDYFKSAPPKKPQTARPNKPKVNIKIHIARSTKTTGSTNNVTIIDDREASGKRKIFDDKDGEYVEFEEV